MCQMWKFWNLFPKKFREDGNIDHTDWNESNTDHIVAALIEFPVRAHTL